MVCEWGVFPGRQSVDGSGWWKVEVRRILQMRAVRNMC